MFSQRDHSRCHSGLQRCSSGCGKTSRINGWSKERMIRARDKNHFENSTFVTLRQFTFEREKDGVAKTAVLHEVLHAIAADQDLVLFNRRQRRFPECIA